MVKLLFCVSESLEHLKDVSMISVVERFPNMPLRCAVGRHLFAVTVVGPLRLPQERYLINLLS